MSTFKHIQRVLLLGLPDPAISLINKGLSSLWEIQPKKLADNSEAVYLFRLNKTDFRYLNSQGSPLPIRPGKEEIGKLKIVDRIRIDGYEDEREKLFF